MKVNFKKIGVEVEADEANENEFHVEVKKNGSEVVCRSKVIFE